MEEHKSTFDIKKRLIIHADDAGLSCSENRATINALEKGCVSSYSIMMPCPGAFEMVNFAKDNPEYDCGVHLTLTCEWKYYKFRPLSPLNEVKSLVDENGFFHSSRTLVKNNVKPEEAMKELVAQIELAINWGLKPTHLDSHMFTLCLTPDLLQVYKDLSKAYSLPILLDKELLTSFGVDITKNISKTDFVIDKLYLGEYSWFEQNNLSGFYNQALEQVTDGLSVLLIHPAFDDYEMQSICVDHPNFGATWRQIDYDYFTSESCKLKLNELNIELTTWKDFFKK